MSLRTDLPDFYTLTKQHNEAMSAAELATVMESGRKWDLVQVLKDRGAIIFPHFNIHQCGSHYAATIHACMNSGVQTVLGIGVLHARFDELQTARVRVANGADITQEPTWGMQGAGLASLTHWQTEFSMISFEHLWHFEAARRREAGLPVPELIVRYPYLAGGRPHILPGIAELQQIVANGAVVVGTADPFHHGLAYGDSIEASKAPNEGGLELCRATVEAGFAMLGAGDYWGFNQHCVSAKSDGRDMGQVLRYILNTPLKAEIHDILWEDMSGPYGKPWPSWVAGCLISLTPRPRLSTDLH
jgi:hypothetical protein